MEEPNDKSSPRWGPMTKLVVGLTMVAIVAALLVQFRGIIGPLILAFVLSYLLYPIAEFLRRVTPLSWRASVNILFLIVLILFLGMITVTGLTVVQQIQSLNNFVQQQVKDLPDLAATLSTQVFRIGTFEFSLGQYDLQALSNQLISTVQPLLGRIGGLISSFATSAAVTLGWSLFVMLVAYFVLVDAGRFPGRMVNVAVPGYDEDLRRLGNELRKIWNAYLRGQLIIILLVIVSYSILMVILGVRFAFGIAILAGLARFVPYVGPLTAWVVTSLVAFFQAQNYFGLEAYQYALLVVATGVILDQIFDNLISPRLLGDTLGVHPAAVLVAAIVAANLIGIIGLVLAAPVLATINLLGRYIMRKMFDLEPWPEQENGSRVSPAPWERALRSLQSLWQTVQERLARRSKGKRL